MYKHNHVFSKVLERNIRIFGLRNFRKHSTFRIQRDSLVQGSPVAQCLSNGHGCLSPEGLPQAMLGAEFYLKPFTSLEPFGHFLSPTNPAWPSLTTNHMPTPCLGNVMVNQLGFTV
jgi:hypothetical protein